MHAYEIGGATRVRLEGAFSFPHRDRSQPILFFASIIVGRMRVQSQLVSFGYSSYSRILGIANSGTKDEDTQELN